ncbi:hypothetical protein SAMN05216268_1337 [Streptomyces yunnanensis]|uniref:Uncharacterized protein n=1 Tax=Streptomyces yunnanensis TaxID=156453 RepID=A0A9X8R053_9ACTN|nr:hypothetical protein SAMN05216268_1337 [Streptomyces yunnanensis]
MPSLSEPVHLPDPSPKPQPVEGCDVCRALIRQRAEHRKHGRHARAALCSLELGDHTHGVEVTG